MINERSKKSVEKHKEYRCLYKSVGCVSWHGLGLFFFLWWKWSLNIFDECHSPCSHYISSQFKNYEGYVRDSSSCHHHHQDSNWGNIFWKNGVQFFLRYHEISRSPEATLEANGSRNLTKTLVRDSIYFHSSTAHHLRPVPIFKHVAKMKMRACTAPDFPVGHQSSPTYHLYLILTSSLSCQTLLYSS